MLHGYTLPWDGSSVGVAPSVLLEISSWVAERYSAPPGEESQKANEAPLCCNFTV